MMRLAITGTYTGDWPEVARAVKGDAGYRCVRCRHPFNPDGSPDRCDADCDRARCRAERIQLRGGKLSFTVHHLDGDKGNNRWWNLLATCNACHLSVQARVIPERPWLLAHSPWFVPFVAGYYAFYYGGLEITPRQARDNPDLYLAMGQPWLYAGASA